MPNERLLKSITYKTSRNSRCSRKRYSGRKNQTRDKAIFVEPTPEFGSEASVITRAESLIGGLFWRDTGWRI